ncbi:diaminopimelate decarboxylase [Arenicella sp. 4NH20-0111]|uniref:diaminopimelate decarboxylase n=1 Tax=Arenicella sp. 4NH20-0111 TaxID=3127648 RepID=UPI00310B087D
MSFFEYQNGHLHAENIPLQKIASAVGTPCYVYSRAAFETQWRTLDTAFGDYPHSIFYAVKANSNIAVLNLLARLGSGFDIVSEGELRRVLAAGGDANNVVFSGVAKSKSELEFAIGKGVRSINIESVAELERVQQVAEKLGVVASIAFRVNPDVDPETHPYISTGMDKAKFGVPMGAAYDAYQRAAALPNIQVHGIACHIGSQITKTSPFSDSLEIVLNLVKRLANKGIEIKQLDLGGGLGIDYQGEVPPSAQEYVTAMLNGVKKHGITLPIGIEPGRYIAGNSGVLLTKVEYLKHNESKNFAIVDAGMNDLLRPSLYQAFHRISAVEKNSTGEKMVFDVVGPVCESSDVLGYDRELDTQAGDLLAVMSAGAYSFSMAGNYNSRVRPAEVMVDDDKVHIIRQREEQEDLIRGESLLPE